MEFEFISAVASTLVGAAAAVLGEYLRRKRQSAENKEKQSLTERVRTLTESLNTSTSLISEIQLEIEKRHELVAELKKYTEHYEALSRLKEKETEAVALLLQGSLRKDCEFEFARWANGASNGLKTNCDATRLGTAMTFPSRHCLHYKAA